MGFGIVAIVGGALALGGAVAGTVSSGKQARRARLNAKSLTGELESLEKSRQDIINPFSTTKDLSSLAQDLSGQMSNPFENLGVATQAAEIQMEQADIALANTLDTLRATGASAGGATALAQAALQSKKGISANIEQQEAQNAKAKAQGEQQLQSRQLAEQQRMQSISISEGQRVQAAEAAGKQFEFQQQENRTNADLDRAAGQISQAAADQASANQAKAAAWGGVASSIGSIGAAAATGK